MGEPFVCVNGLDLEAAVKVWIDGRPVGQPYHVHVEKIIAAALGECSPPQCR